MPTIEAPLKPQATPPQFRQSVQTEPNAPSADRRAGQTERLRTLWNARRPIALTTLTAFLLSCSFSVLIPTFYTATTQLMPPDSESASGVAMVAALSKAGGGAGSLAGDVLGLKSTGSLFVGILRSESSQISLVERFDLKKVYRVKLTQDARAQLDERTVISEDRKSGIITISVTDVSPPRAAALANAYVDQLNTLVTDSSTSSAHRERVFLEDRLKVAKQELDQASSELAQFSSQNSTLDMQQMGKAMLDATGNVAAQLIAAESELQGLRQMYTDDNARVQSLSGRVAELRKQLARMQGGTGTAAVRAGLNSPVAAAQPVQPGDMPYPTLRSLPILGVKYANYFRRAKIQETVYELLTEQYELAKIQEVKETPSVKVLDRARVPERRSFPPRMLIVALGTFFALSACLVCVAALSSWQATDPQDPRKLFVRQVARELFATVSVQQARQLWPSRNGRYVSPNSGSPGSSLDLPE
ncbi:MAG: lipopolysaccharide biosynthesis protein [Candidatus Sulfotelmatobacter sp.]